MKILIGLVLLMAMFYILRYLYYDWLWIKTMPARFKWLKENTYMDYDIPFNKDNPGEQLKIKQGIDEKDMPGFKCLKYI